MTDSPENPVNREPPLQDLIAKFITPVQDGYDRNHSDYPKIDGNAHKVVVDGHVSNEVSLSILDLQKLPQHTVVCALQCAGNRRHTMRTKLKEVDGVDWFDGAVMNCKWRGPLLCDVLSKAGTAIEDKDQGLGHVAFASYEAKCQDDAWYGASIPLERAIRPDAEIILALEMNDEPLTVAHGYPVRVVTPGIAGARSVKWLNQITVQKQESQNHYQQRDYKILPPEVEDAKTAENYWDDIPAIMEMPVNSVIAWPESGSAVHREPDGSIALGGYALPSGENGPVVKVEVSWDGGSSWTHAELIDHENESKWSWKLWKAKIVPKAGNDCVLYSRATDAAGNTQPEDPQWNLRGVCYNGWGAAENLNIQ